MEDKENKFGSFNVKEFRNVDGPLQKKFHMKLKQDAYEYHYKQKDESHIATSIGQFTNQHNDPKIHLSFFNPINYSDYALPHNLFQHCNSITIQQQFNQFIDPQETPFTKQPTTQIITNPNNSLSHIDQTTQDLKLDEISDQTSFFTHIGDQDESIKPNWPVYEKMNHTAQYQQFQNVLIQGPDLAELLNTIQKQAEEIVRIKRQQQQSKFNTSHLQSKIMEEKKFTSLQQLNRNSTAQQNYTNRGELTLLQKLRKP